MDLTDYHKAPADFCDAFVHRNEKDQRWRLSPHQRRVLARTLVWDEDGRLLLRLFLFSEMKKSGKSFLASCLRVVVGIHPSPHGSDRGRERP